MWDFSCSRLVERNMVFCFAFFAFFAFVFIIEFVFIKINNYIYEMLLVGTNIL